MKPNSPAEKLQREIDRERKRYDAVNNPGHYQAGGIQAIDVIEAFGLGFNLGNVVKYVLRHEKKGGIESLRKARWYLDRQIASMEAKP